jgi:zinc protease
MNRKMAPATQMPQHFNVDLVQKETLSTGFPLYIVSGTAQDIFQLELVFNAGRYFESKRMLAGLCASMILKGTTKKSAFEIAESFDFYGASVKFQANMYTAQLSLYCLNSEVPLLLPLLLEIMQEAHFSEEEILKAKAKTKQKLAVQWEKNSYAATQYFNQAIFGENHAFGYLSKPEQLDNINRTDLQEHFAKQYRLSSSGFAVVAGKISAKEIGYLQDFLKELPFYEFQKPKIDLSPYGELEQFISSKKSLQAAIRVGMPTISIHHEDYDDLQFLNTVLGGYFGSRLMSNIREEKGYTYGIYSFVNAIRDTAYFCISTEVGAEYKKATLHEIEKEIIRLKNEAIEEEELMMVKNYLIGQLMKSIDGPLNIMSTLKNFLIFDLDLGEVNKQLEAIYKMDAKRLQDLANTYLDEKAMYKIVVG